MVMIRFVRMGRNKQAFFHLVAAEKARAVQKKYIEKLGHYNPHAEKGKGALSVNTERVLFFVKNGAQMSQTVARVLMKHGIKEAGKFVVQRGTKPKRTPAPTEAAVSAEAAV